MSSGPPICAACAKPAAADLWLEAAHIVPLEECGETVIDNLLPLCRRPGKRAGDQGCHQLFDKGCASVAEVTELRKEWIVNSVRGKMREIMKRRFEHDLASSVGATNGDEIQSMITRREWTKAIRLLRQQLLNPERDAAETFRRRLKIVEIHRRRYARGALDVADRLYRELEQETCPESVRSWFYYEGGYINLLSGRHDGAKELFERSRAVCAKGTKEGNIEWVAATCLVVHASIASRGAKSDFNRLEKKMLFALDCAAKAHDVHGKRWYANCLWIIARLWIVAGKRRKALTSFERAMSNWRSLTVQTGWDIGYRTTILSMRGQLAVMGASTRQGATEALRYLSRALMLLLSSGREHPEGVRDVLDSIEKAFTIMGRSRQARRVRKVMVNTRDGSSWVAPYQDVDFRK